MRTVFLDKIGSVTMNCRLSREVRLGDDIPAVEGGVVAVRVLNSKSSYNTLELPSGRFSKVKAGDIYETLLRVFEIARREKIPTYRAADRLAEKRIEAVRKLKKTWL